MPLSRSPRLASAVPRLFCVVAQLERDALAGPLGQGLAKSGDGLIEPRGAALALAKAQKRIAEIVLRRRPLERDALAGPLGQGLAKSGDGLFEPRGAALALAQASKRSAEIVLRRRPVERDALAGLDA